MSQMDYEEDLQQLQRVWRDIKQPSNKVNRKNQNDSTQCRTNESKKQNGKKCRVLVSDQNLRQTMKYNDEGVISVVTHPIKVNNDLIYANIHQTTPEILLLTNPEGQRIIQTEGIKRIMIQKDQEISLLRVLNSRSEDKIKQLQAMIEEKDLRIEQLRGRERQLSSQLSALASKDFNFTYGKVEYENYRHDSQRLLKILKTTTEYRYFAEFALLDEGVRFLTNANKTNKTNLDIPQNTQIHFCSCNKAFIPEPFLWVPEKVHNYGRQFVRDHQGQLGQNEMELLLYELNKIWREREKIIINRLSSEKAVKAENGKRSTKQLKQMRLIQE